jgi:hypothetical protein
MNTAFVVVKLKKIVAAPLSLTPTLVPPAVRNTRGIVPLAVQLAWEADGKKLHAATAAKKANAIFIGFLPNARGSGSVIARPGRLPWQITNDSGYPVRLSSQGRRVYRLPLELCRV